MEPRISMSPATPRRSRVLLINGMPQANITITPPIGLYKLRHWLERRGHSCEVFSPDVDGEEGFLEKVRRGAFDAIGIGGSQWNLADDAARIGRFRKAVAGAPGPAVFIAGGQAAALDPDLWLDLGIEAVFLGFAERPLGEFCDRLAEAGPGADWRTAASGVRGIVHRDAAGRTVTRPAEPLTEDHFREISHERARELDVPYRKYWDRLRERSGDTSLGSRFVFEYVRLFTSSHCPRGCGFCNSQSFLPASQGSQTRIFLLSAEEILDLILHHVERHGARGFAFSDDDFPVGGRIGIERLRRVCDGIAREKREGGRLDRGMAFACQARIADFLGPGGTPDRDLLDRMARAGLRSIALGVETFSERLLRVPSIGKAGVSVTDCLAVLDAMLGAGLAPLMNLILGIPEATPEELAETLETALEYVVKGCEINITGPMYALPGAPIFGDVRYPIHRIAVPDPFTGQTFRVAHHYIPRDDGIARLSEGYDALFAEEIEALLDRRELRGKILHKRAKNVLAIVVAAKGIERADLEARALSVLDDVLAGRLRIDG